MQPKRRDHPVERRFGSHIAHLIYEKLHRMKFKEVIAELMDSADPRHIMPGHVTRRTRKWKQFRYTQGTEDTIIVLEKGRNHFKITTNRAHEKKNSFLSP